MHKKLNVAVSFLFLFLFLLNENAVAQSNCSSKNCGLRKSSNSIDKLPANNGINTWDGNSESKIFHEKSDERLTDQKLTLPIKYSEQSLHQEITGFGGSLTDSSVANIMKLSGPNRTKLLQKIFSKKDGFGLDFLRIPVGASDFSRDDYTYNDLPAGSEDPELKHFSMKRDEQTIQLLKEIKKINPSIKVMLTPWSAPAWMKINKKLTGGGDNNKLDSKNYSVYAEYLKKVIETYDKNGINVHSITPQNEPEYSAPYPGMVMTAKEQSEFIASALGPKLKELNLSSGKKSPLILAFDHNWSSAESFTEELMKNKHAAEHIDGIGLHCYEGSVQSVKTVITKSVRDVYQTECTGTQSESYQDDFDWWLHNQVVRSSQLGSKSSLAWNLVLDEKGGPRHEKTCDHCRGMVTLNSKTNEISFNPELKALSMASKYLTDGARRMDVSSIPGTDTVGFINKDQSKVIIIKNDKEDDQTFTVEDSSCRRYKINLPAGKAITLRIP